MTRAGSSRGGGAWAERGTAPAAKPWGHALYRAMKDGEDAEVARLLSAPDRQLDVSPGGPVALPTISAVLSERTDYLKALLDAGAAVNGRELSPKPIIFMTLHLQHARITP